MKSYDVAKFGAPLQAFDRNTPTPTGTEVLLRVRAAGVCHTDLHLRDGFYDMGGGKRLMMEDRGVELPLTPGHEVVGEVVSSGPDADRAKPGDIRLIYPWIGCCKCPVCLRGEEQLCLASNIIGIHRPGGYSDHIIVPHPRYLLDIGDMSPAQAAPYACSGLTSYGALKKVGRSLGETPILIIGAGGLGLACLSLMKAMGAKGAVVVDIDEAKREAALKAGALAAVDGRAPDAREKVIEAVGGQLWAAIDFVGSETTAQFALNCVTRGGKLILVGLFGGAITLPLPMIPTRALTIQGSYVGSLDEMAELLALVGRGPIAQIPITERPLDDAESALRDLKANRQIGRSVLIPR